MVSFDAVSSLSWAVLESCFSTVDSGLDEVGGAEASLGCSLVGGFSDEVVGWAGWGGSYRRGVVGLCLFVTSFILNV